MANSNSIKGNFGYSAVGIKDLQSSEYTLVTIVVDRSSSVAGFKDELTKCLKEIVQACKFSPRADNLLVRIVQFGSTLDEIHGFKMLSAINPDDYDSALVVGGMTALNDASFASVNATLDYGKQLTDQDFSCNAIVFVLTDGAENVSVMTADAVKDVLAKATKNEQLESLVSILVGVNVSDPSLAQLLADFQKAVGFTDFQKIEDASAKSLAKLAKFVSKSISAQSQALGTGGPSQPLTI